MPFNLPLAGHERLFELKSVLDVGGSRLSLLQQVADFLRRSGNHRWVGLYDVDHRAGEVRNVVFSGSGAPLHPRFSIHKGLTGVAIAERRTVNIGDVTLDPRYLTAFGSTRSEIVVPIFDAAKNRVAGTIDVESEAADAFQDSEQMFLEDCAVMIQRLWQ